MSDLRSGMVLDRTYRVIRRIAEGGMGVVYEATHLRTHRRVALKLLHGHLAEHGDIIERFRREALICGELGHPNIVGVLDFNRIEGGDTYLAMEYLEGQDLARMLRKKGRLSVEQAVEIAVQTGEALTTAHEQGIVHRDLKPQNIFLIAGRRLMVKVLDFGISKMLGARGGDMTKTSVLLGTPQYMAPEQVREGARNVDARADQFSLGVIVYQMLTGQVPFEGESTAETVDKIVHAEARPPSELEATVTPDLDKAILRALSKGPDSRFGDVHAFVKALVVAAGHKSGLFAITPSPRKESVQPEAATEYSPITKKPASPGMAKVAADAVKTVAIDQAPTAHRSAVPGRPATQEITPVETDHARLVVDKGPDSGKTFQLRDGKSRVGRAPGSEVKLTDDSISRHHFFIEGDDGRYFLQDLGSGNGTLVSGNRVHRAELHDGDTIQVGSTEMSFRWVATFLPDSLMIEEGPDPRRWWLLGAAAGAVVLVVAVVLLLNRPSAIDSDALLQAARAAIKDQEYELAKARLERAAELEPGDESVDQQLQWARREVRAQLGLREARNAGIGGDFFRARRALAAVPRDSDQGGAIGPLGAWLNSREADELISQAIDSKAGGDPDGALGLLDRALGLRPNDTGALGLKAELERRSK